MRMLVPLAVLKLVTKMRPASAKTAADEQPYGPTAQAAPGLFGDPVGGVGRIAQRTLISFGATEALR